MDKKLVKSVVVVAVDTLVGIGAGMVVGAITKAVLPEPKNKLDSVLTKVGTAAITMTVMSVIHTELARNINAFDKGVATGRKLAEEGDNDGN